MKYLVVGGSFDDNGGRSSSLVSKFEQELKNAGVEDVKVLNGGQFSEIEGILERTKDADMVLWWANVPNDKPKIRDVKSVNPKCMLVTSKRNDGGKYNFSELINRALGAKANLCVEFSKVDDRFQMFVFAPLGNEWYKGFDIGACCKALASRLEFLNGITREGCVPAKFEAEVPDDKEFFQIVKDYAKVFHELINPAKEVTRYLGNSSFRCQRGFPSFRQDGIVYVSRRNVDKRFIDKDNFVPTMLSRYHNGVLYQGEYKPSVDTPIQLRLYEALPNINYMIHAHVYLEGAPFTKHMVPCGGLEEVGEVLSVLEDDSKDFYAVNLIGHGCIAMAKTAEQLKGLPYVGRVLPERIGQGMKKDEQEEMER